MARYDDFDLMVNHAGGGIIGFPHLIAVVEKASELYAESLRKEIAELDEQLQLYHNQITELKAEIEKLK